MRIRIDREKCMGSGNCGFLAPSTFDLDAEMKAIVIDPLGDDVETVTLAVDGCPTKAISVDLAAD